MRRLPYRRLHAWAQVMVHALPTLQIAQTYANDVFSGPFA
jgi:hypothetical protein